MSKNLKGKSLAKRTKTMRIPISQLTAGLPSQRPVNQKRVDEIVENFDWNLLEVLVVSFRDGQYYVVDGQHRLFALRLLFGDNLLVDCDVRFDLTEEDEADLFERLAVGKKQVSIMDRLRSSYYAKRDDTLNFVNAIRDSGFVLDFTLSKTKNKVICVEALGKIFNKMSLEDFRRLLTLIQKTWSGDKDSLNIPLLRGMYEFYTVYKDEIKEEMFIKKLSQYSPKDIIKDGKTDQVSEGYVGYAKAILIRYNKGLAEKNRLNKFKLF